MLFNQPSIFLPLVQTKSQVSFYAEEHTLTGLYCGRQYHMVMHQVDIFFVREGWRYQIRWIGTFPKIHPIWRSHPSLSRSVFLFNVIFYKLIDSTISLKMVYHPLWLKNALWSLTQAHHPYHRLVQVNLYQSYEGPGCPTFLRCCAFKYLWGPVMKLCSPYFRHQIFIMVPQHIPTCQNPTMGFDSNDSKQLGICQRRIPTTEYNGGDGDDNEKNRNQCISMTVPTIKNNRVGESEYPIPIFISLIVEDDVVNTSLCIRTGFWLVGICWLAFIITIVMAIHQCWGHKKLYFEPHVHFLK